MSEKRAEWIAYADGSCIGNPGPGGWGVVLIDPQGRSSELAGASRSTTNNRMEITAAVEALRKVPPGAGVALHSDSQYVIKTMTLGWKRRENVDLWPLLDAEVAKHSVRWEWVRGHNGNPLNERADELARSAAEGRLPSPRARGGQAAIRAPGDNYDTDWTMAELTPLMRPGETIRHCKGCRRVFVTTTDAEFCSLAPCQIRARSRG